MLTLERFSGLTCSGFFFTTLRKNKAKAISAELLELYLKNKLEEMNKIRKIREERGSKGNKWEQTGRNGKNGNQI